MAKRKTGKGWKRRKLREERETTVQDSNDQNHTAYFGIAEGGDVAIYLDNGWHVYTTADVCARPPDGRKLVGADNALTKERVAQCRRKEWGIHHFPVVVFLKTTPTHCIEQFRGQASEEYAQTEQVQQENAKQIAPKLRDGINELVELYRLYIQIEGKIEGDEAPEEAAIREGIDKEIAVKLKRCLEHAPYLCNVFRTIVNERFNGQFNVVDAYHEIAPPSQPQARFAIDLALEVSEIAYQCNRIIALEGLTRKYPGLKGFTVDTVADLCVAALFSHNACWGTDGVVADHEAKSAANYVLMRHRITHLPPIEDLIENHGNVWHHDWVYAIYTEVSSMVSGATHKAPRTSYRLGNGPNQDKRIKAAVEASLNQLIDLAGVGVTYNVQVWNAEASLILYIIIIAVAEKITEATQTGAGLSDLFAELAGRVVKPQDPDYTIETHLRNSLPLYSRVVAAAAAKYDVIPRGAIVLFANGTGEQYSEPARHVAVDGGIAIALGSDPPELLLISHDDIAGLLEEPRSASTLAKVAKGSNEYPMMHFISFAHGPHRQVYQNRGTVLGIIDRESLDKFLAPRMHMIDQARTHLTS